MYQSFALVCISAIIYLSSCVPARQYQDAITARDKCYQDTTALNNQLRIRNAEVAQLNKDITDFNARMLYIVKDSADIHKRYDEMIKANKELREIEEKLNTRINQLLSLSSTENQELREDLQKNLEDLNAKEKQLKDRESRVKELEDILNKQEQVVTDLKNKIDQALSGFSATDLTVERKNGKVYVSLSEKLLFATGSTAVDPKGKDALKKLAEVLQKNPDIQIEIEGHTDNVPLKSGSFPKDNWDLSVLRATSIVKILTQENGIDTKRISASGRGEFTPVAGNETSEGRAKNRRTEIVLSPNLDALFNLISPN